MRILTDKELLAAIQAVDLSDPAVRLTYDSGPYDITHPSTVATKLALFIQIKFCEINGLVGGAHALERQEQEPLREALQKLHDAVRGWPLPGGPSVVQAMEAAEKVLNEGAADPAELPEVNGFAEQGAKRAAFIAHFKPLQPLWQFQDDGTGGFHNQCTEWAWIGWRAARTIGVAQAVELLDLFTRAAYPVAKEINPRGYNWSEAYLDQALAQVRRAGAGAVDGA